MRSDEGVTTDPLVACDLCGRTVPLWDVIAVGDELAGVIELAWACPPCAESDWALPWEPI